MNMQIEARGVSSTAGERSQSAHIDNNYYTSLSVYGMLNSSRAMKSERQLGKVCSRRCLVFC